MADQKREMMFFVWFSEVLVNLEVEDRRKSLDKFVPRHRGRSKIRNAKVYDFDPQSPLVTHRNTQRHDPPALRNAEVSDPPNTHTSH